MSTMFHDSGATQAVAALLPTIAAKYQLTNAGLNSVRAEMAKEEAKAAKYGADFIMHGALAEAIGGAVAGACEVGAGAYGLKLTKDVTSKTKTFKSEYSRKQADLAEAKRQFETGGAKAVVEDTTKAPAKGVDLAVKVRKDGTPLGTDPVKDNTAVKEAKDLKALENDYLDKKEELKRLTKDHQNEIQTLNNTSQSTSQIAQGVGALVRAGCSGFKGMQDAEKTKQDVMKSLYEQSYQNMDQAMNSGWQTAQGIEQVKVLDYLIAASRSA